MVNGTSHPRVLVLDDDTEFATLIHEILRTEGFDPVLGGAAEPIESLMTPQPGLVLLDYVMPRRDEVVDAASGGRFGHVPIVLLSGVHDIADRAKEIGAEAFVAKPFDIDDLVRTCRAAAAA